MSWHSRVWDMANKHAVYFGFRSTLEFLEYVRSCAPSDWDELTVDQQVEVIETVCSSIKREDGQPPQRRDPDGGRSVRKDSGPRGSGKKIPMGSRPKADAFCSEEFQRGDRRRDGRRGPSRSS